MKSPWKKLWGRVTDNPDRVIALGSHVGAQFNRDQCFISAGMLTYATLLSLVPLTTLVVSMMAALPGAGDWSLQIQQFLFNNFVPAARDTIQSGLNNLIQNARGLTATMGVFLLVTSIILMHNIEITINKIFGVRTDRNLMNRFMVYWAALSLGPILLGASLALSSYFFSLRFVSRFESVGFLAGLLHTLTPLAVAALAFFLTFTMVPNRKVPWRNALVGAVITAFMFELAKFGFGLYVSTFDGYAKLYGALAAIPIFLIWIYMSWSIILLGASLTAALSTFRYSRARDGWPRLEEFILQVRLLGHLWVAHRSGEGMDELAMLELEKEASDEQVQRLLEDMRRANIVRRDEAGEWVLVRDLNHLSIGELYRSGVYHWPAGGVEMLREKDDPWNRRLASALRESCNSLAEVLERPMIAIFAGPMGLDHQQSESVTRMDQQKV